MYLLRMVILHGFLYVYQRVSHYPRLEIKVKGRNFWLLSNKPLSRCQQGPSKSFLGQLVALAMVIRRLVLPQLSSVFFLDAEK